VEAVEVAVEEEEEEVVGAAAWGEDAHLQAGVMSQAGLHQAARDLLLIMPGPHRGLSPAGLNPLAQLDIHRTFDDHQVDPARCPASFLPQHGFLPAVHQGWTIRPMTTSSGAGTCQPVRVCLAPARPVQISTELCRTDPRHAPELQASSPLIVHRLPETEKEFQLCPVAPESRIGL